MVGANKEKAYIEITFIAELYFYFIGEIHIIYLWLMHNCNSISAIFLKRNRHSRHLCVRLLDEWASSPGSLVSGLLDHLETLGRKDAVNALLSGCSLYRYTQFSTCCDIAIIDKCAYKIDQDLDLNILMMTEF